MPLDQLMKDRSMPQGAQKVQGPNLNQHAAHSKGNELSLEPVKPLLNPLFPFLRQVGKNVDKWLWMLSAVRIMTRFEGDCNVVKSRNGSVQADFLAWKIKFLKRLQALAKGEKKSCSGKCKTEGSCKKKKRKEGLQPQEEEEEEGAKAALQNNSSEVMAEKTHNTNMY